MSSRPPETDPLAVEDLRFAVRRSARRRTVGITVRRDGALVAAAPLGMSTPALKRILRAKLPWVRRKLADLAALGPPPEPRSVAPVSYTHSRAHEPPEHLVCRLLLEKKTSTQHLLPHSHDHPITDT